MDRLSVEWGMILAYVLQAEQDPVGKVFDPLMHAYCRLRSRAP